MHTAHPSLVISYLLLRKLIGLLGCALPFVLAIGAWLISGMDVQPSISDYYHTVMRDMFVGILFAIAIFMLSYRGYEPADDRAGDIACISAIFVALFPVAPLNPTPAQEVLGTLHYISAAVFFLTLAYFSLVLFTKSDPTIPPTPRKIVRNRVYRICGWTIIACLALIVLVGNFASAPVKQLDPVFWLEALAIIAFGFSWLTKGEAILADQP
ncbi:MAG: DUF998 domain-containing protein [Xanthomonadales bacterium]|nr:DUF998 domain-containing protein [Gammaproteobacteria bacterium]NNE04651.1 DUF998 domain-containing protein [Xanthomonadales bacterium]NNL94514.1 DUF998 domain-containing protein [Xanthomonadales bacterium]